MSFSSQRIVHRAECENLLRRSRVDGRPAESGSLLTVGSLKHLAMCRSLGTLLNMATHYSHDNMLFTAIAENATAIAVSTYFVEASVRVASGSFLERLDSDIP